MKYLLPLLLLLLAGCKGTDSKPDEFHVFLGHGDGSIDRGKGYDYSGDSVTVGWTWHLGDKQDREDRLADWAELRQSILAVEKAVARQPAPVVNVPAPQVTVQAPTPPVSPPAEPKAQEPAKPLPAPEEQPKSVVGVFSNLEWWKLVIGAITAAGLAWGGHRGYGAYKARKGADDGAA
jgi:hypothetical protein